MDKDAKRTQQSAGHICGYGRIFVVTVSAFAFGLEDEDYAYLKAQHIERYDAAPMLDLSNDVMDGRLNRITGETLIDFLTDPMFEFHGRCNRAQSLF